MALRKSSTVEQVAEAVRRADPDDRPVVTLAVLPGPSPWRSALMSGQFDAEEYFFTLTEHTVLLHRIEFLRHRPGAPAYALPRSEAVRRFVPGQRRTLWSWFRFRLPGEPAPTRMNVRRAWRPELDRLADALAGHSVGGIGPGHP
ncbi:hypothetical protein [Kitasatospora sp. NPDC094015]|uniref:hypothetical protein n=1 Tax=Kitasatospora sp. NPDC094015 TaxID=3155205 RepID=UPI0033347C05